MFKSFTFKFTFFFWMTFFIIIIPLYLIGTYYTKNALIETEEEKISLLVQTLRPTIALSLSFDQKKQLKTIIDSILTNKEIQEIKITIFDTGTPKKNSYKNSSKTEIAQKLFSYKSLISDPFTHNKLAEFEIFYINKHLTNYNLYLYKIILLLFLFFLVTFIIFFLLISKDLSALKQIAISLKKYSSSKEDTPIEIPKASLEMTTIAKVANEMISSISEYLIRLQTFNDDLQKQVATKVQEQKEQEKLMLHQSRQAAMGEMLESIAHQWRQPLNNIGLASANLTMQHALDKLDDQDFEEKMEIISTNLEYMSTTIDDFRDFLDPNQKKDFFNPCKTVEDTLKIMRAQLKRKNISYRATCKFNS
ncbi:MAG: histidine kinase dimerization/phospho-acceptor domain-containing protein [Sulfurimonas sp.]